MARTRCEDCKQFARFESTQPAVGVAGRVHKLGEGCKKDAVQVTKVATKPVAERPIALPAFGYSHLLAGPVVISAAPDGYDGGHFIGDPSKQLLWLPRRQKLEWKPRASKVA